MIVLRQSGTQRFRRVRIHETGAYELRRKGKIVRFSSSGNLQGSCFSMEIPKGVDVVIPVGLTLHRVP